MVQLHVHTFASLNDATNTPDEVLQKCREQNMTAVAVTDHGNLIAIEEFKAAFADEKRNPTHVKLIPGVEAYVDVVGNGTREHLVLLAMDYTGYIAICKAVTASYQNMDAKGFPIMTLSILKEHFGQGSSGHGHVIATSACMYGVLSHCFLFNYELDEEIEKMRAKANKEIGKFTVEDLKKKFVDLDIDWGKDLNAPGMTVYPAIRDEYDIAKRNYDAAVENRQKASELKSKKYTQREKAASKIEDEETRNKTLAEIAKEKEETQFAIDNYDRIKTNESNARKQFSNAKTAIEWLEGKKEKSDAYLEEAENLKQNKVSLETMTEIATGRAKMFTALFGEGNFYAELQYHGIEAETICYPQVALLAHNLGMPMIVTNDVHYAENTTEARLRRQILRSLRFNHWEEEQVGDGEYYFKDVSELRETVGRILPLSIVDEAIAETDKLAARCNVEFVEQKHYPKFKTPNGEDPETYLKELVKLGKERRYPNKEGWTVAHRDRVMYELSVIKKLEVIDYILIVQDFLEYGRLLGKIDLKDPRYLADPYNVDLLRELAEGKVGVGVGPGRGSAAGSLVCYLIGITDVDPMKHQLLFDRFLNKDRVTMPKQHWAFNVNPIAQGCAA